jgi:hypothetical protein
MRPTGSLFCVYHVEISQDNTHVRAFNLTSAELERRFLTPLRAGRRFVCEEKEFDPGSARLRVLEGPQLRLDQLTLGRGWTEAERVASDVTERFSGADTGSAAADEHGVRASLKDRILGRVSGGPAPLSELPQLAAELMPGSRASEQLAETELAVWELLHRQQLQIYSAQEPLARDRWEAAVLNAGSWFGSEPVTVSRP